MSPTRTDPDIDLALDDHPPAVHVRPAQPYVNASRVALAGLIALTGGIFIAAYSGALSLESKALPLLMALFILLGSLAIAFREYADRIDTPAILIDDQEV